MTAKTYDACMTSRRRTYEQWRTERNATAAWVELVDRALPAYARRRPRDRKEAELLRRRGSSERLIGPSRLD